MPHYTGTANSYTELRTALFNACVANGWTLNTDILSKSAAFVQLTINTVTSATLGTGLIVQGGTGASGGALTGASANKGRLGPAHQSISPVTWPMTYNVHIYDNPDEVYLVARYDGDKYLWLAFGVSDVSGLTGTGLWFDAVCHGGQGPSSSGVDGGITISATSGGNAAPPNNPSAAGLFWNTQQRTTGGSYANSSSIHSNFDGTPWAGNPASPGVANAQYMSGVDFTGPHIARSPNAWNGESVLLPVALYVSRTPNKVSLAADLNNARYLRIDNHTPEDVIVLGTDKWKVYPFYKKNSTSRDGGSSVDHSGTFGFAIRYDGA